MISFWYYYCDNHNLLLIAIAINTKNKTTLKLAIMSTSKYEYCIFRSMGLCKKRFEAGDVRVRIGQDHVWSDVKKYTGEMKPLLKSDEMCQKCYAKVIIGNIMRQNAVHK